MTLPQGLAWQQLRQEALAVFPKGTSLSRNKPSTLAEWYRSGVIIPSVSSHRKSLAFLAPQSEIAKVLLSESALFLDAATEHAVTARNQLNAGRWYSAAWLCVTFYYWAFFLALSFTRMTSRTVVFLNKTTIADLHLISGSNDPSPGAGAYILVCTNSNTPNLLSFEVSKSRESRLHELLWKVLFERIKALREISGNSNPDEERLFRTLELTFDRLGDAWPSDLRNIANYSPGKAYSAGRQKSNFYGFGHIQVNQPLSFEDSLNRLENNVLSIPANSTISAYPKLAVSILIDLTFALHRIAQQLQEDVIERRDIDRRWLTSRAEFLKLNCEIETDKGWPYRN
ncbi:hypothetical protein [Aestuariivirga sp.]|uniref:hypothetical protein n=1 Tax=Aestuariivirga sp. TaxID=2650926 RepID=UPI00359443BC